jgi:uncharacterized iron-regulated membrane protein
VRVGEPGKYGFPEIKKCSGSFIAAEGLMSFELDQSDMGVEFRTFTRPYRSHNLTGTRMKTFTFLGCLLALLLTGQFAQAQTKGTAKPAAKPAVAKPTTPAAKPAAAAPKPAATAAPVVAVAAPALITDKMMDPTPNTNALKVRAEANPLTKRLTVRTDATGPTRVELNGTDGRPVLTRDLISGDAAAVLDVSNLPAGSYIVQCTSGERRGLKRVMVGQ